MHRRCRRCATSSGAGCIPPRVDRHARRPHPELVAPLRAHVPASAWPRAADRARAGARALRRMSPQVVWHAFDSLPGDIWIVLVFVFAAPALAAYRWMRPVWSDLVMVRERAIDFTGGRFNTRARESHSVIIGPLARTLNALAMRMERLIAAQRPDERDLARAAHATRARAVRARNAARTGFRGRIPGRAREHRAGRDRLEELIDMSLTYARLEYSSLQSNLEMTAPSRGSSIRSAMRSCCIRSARSSRASRSRRTCA